MERQRNNSTPKFKVKGLMGRTAADQFSAWYFPSGRPDPKVYREIGNRWEDSALYQFEEQQNHGFGRRDDD